MNGDRAEGALGADLQRQVFERNEAVQLLIDPADGRIVDANPAAVGLYGRSREELRALRITDLNAASPDEVQRAMTAAARGEQRRFEWQHRVASGELRDVEVYSGPVEVGGRTLLYSIVHDVTRHQRVEHLQAALYRISDVASSTENVGDLCRELHAIVGGLMFADNLYIALDDPVAGTLSFPYWVDQFDPPPPPEPYGRGLTEYVLRTGEPLLADPKVFEALVASGEVEQVGADSVDWLGVPLRGSEGILGVLVVQSYSESHRFSEEDREVLTFVSRHVATALERKRADEQIRRLAYHDGLTGLPNRLLFEDRLDMAIAQARRAEQRVAVFFLDLDRFKVINDSMGHRVGDRLLRELAARLATSVRDGDTVARLGGDEFAFVVTGLSREDEVAAVATRVLESVRQPLHVEKRQLWVSASLGASLFPDDGPDAELLIRHADAAMYRAKEQGRDGFQLYSPAMSASVHERLALETDLRRALAQDELHLHFQPILECGTGRVHGLEALLRWETGERCVLPSEFIPMAELTGLILPIGSFVLARACSALKALHDRGWNDLRMGVNLSARQLQQPNLVDLVVEALATARLEPRFLDLEITESHALQSAEATIETLQHLRALGVTLSIDDFGTGYSSLSYLQRLPVHAVKLDRSFVRDTPINPDNAAIACAVIDLAHALGMVVVAEGVETEAQRVFLEAHGCDRMQGYLLSRPMPESELVELLGRSAPISS